MIQTRTYDNDQIRAIAPSVFAETPWTGMSSKYTFVPSINIVEGLRKEGFNVVQVGQSRTRIEGKGDFTKHLLRFRKADQNISVGDTFPEVVLINSHDGTSAYHLHAGLFRLVCSNGLVTGAGTYGEYKTRHSGDILGEVIDASYKIVEEFPALADQVARWRALPLTEEQQLAFADSARSIRWEEGQAQPEPSQLLAFRRYGDRVEGSTLWGTYNRVQEALLRGGNAYRSRTDAGVRRNRTRAVVGIDQSVKLNKALWTLTEKMEGLLHANVA